MEGSRQSSMAQLSAWTDVMKKSSSKFPDKSKHVEVDEEYEDEFEDYDEDFETETPIKAPPKPTAQPAKSSNISIEPLRISGAKVTSDMEKISTSRTNNYSNLGASIARSITDPRMVRIQRVRESRVLDMQVEKFTNINILPSSRHDLYMQQLRKANPLIKQVGTPNDLEAREVEVNTDEIVAVDKEVQFCYGDDTLMYKLMDTIVNSKSHSASKFENPSIRQILQENYRSITAREETADTDTFQTAGRLSSFLQKTSIIFDALLQPQRIDNTTSRQNETVRSIFCKSPSSDRQFGERSSDGSLELIKYRKVVHLNFSRKNPSLFLVCHSYPTDNHSEDDLRPYKALVSIWDWSTISAPIFILEVSGQLTTVCFSNIQEYIVVGGASDGTLHVWDLRESSGLHQDSDSKDLNISKGIRSPSFSTHLSVGSMMDGDDDILHTSPISHLESIDFDENFSFSTARASQFVSLDEGGCAIFWITNERQETVQENLRRSPWGKVFLLATRQIELKFTFSSQLHTKPDKAKGSIKDFLDTKCPVFQSAGCMLAAIPTDSSSILISSVDGTVYRYSRSGELVAPNSFRRMASATTIQKPTAAEIRSSQHIKSYQQITCMVVRSYTPNSDLELLLVGRSDGSIDLFNLKDEFPIFSWSNLSNTDKLGQCGIKFITWLNELQFLVVNENGMSYFFDLRENSFQAILSERLGHDANLVESAIAISSPRNVLEERRLVMSAGGKEQMKILSMCISKALTGHVTEEDIRTFERNIFCLGNKSPAVIDITII